MKIWEPPAQIAALDGLTEQLGAGLIVTVALPLMVTVQPVTVLLATTV